MLIGDNSNLLKLYEFLMLRRILASDPDTRWCPGPNCTYAVIAAGCASCPRITCERPGCGYSFCYHCKAEWHPNQTCDMARAQRQPHQFGGAFRSSSASFSQESGCHPSEVKVCPRCHVLIVKMDDGSCNHMTCSVCGSEFCWLCMKEISGKCVNFRISEDSGTFSLASLINGSNFLCQGIRIIVKALVRREK